MPPPPLRISLLLGSSRAKRIGASVAGHIEQRLVARGHEVHLLDPRGSHDGYFMQLMEKAHFHYKEGEAVPPALDAAAAALRASDAFVVCTPEMNHTIAPALTNMMNYFGAKTYAYKPSGICTYSAGMWGGARCGVALRAYLSELGCLPVSATMQLTGAWKGGTFDESGSLADDSMGFKLGERMLDQLEWHAHSMRNHRELTREE